jgi:hypothetical protein
MTFSLSGKGIVVTGTLASPFFVPWNRADSIGKTDRSILEILVIVLARRLEVQPDTSGRNQRRC